MHSTSLNRFSVLFLVKPPRTPLGWVGIYHESRSRLLDELAITSLDMQKPRFFKRGQNTQSEDFHQNVRMSVREIMLPA